MAQTPNPIQIQTFLEGVEYPADKEALLRAAEEHNADDNVLSALRSLPERSYGKPTEVSEAVSDSSGGGASGAGEPAADDDERGGERFDAG